MSVPPSAGPLSQLVGGVRDIVRRLTPTYFFKRGPIDYTAWPYETHPRVISMQIDESEMLKEFNNAVLTFELSTTIADAPGENEVLSIDDGIQDAMRGHLAFIITEMRKIVASDGDAFVIGMTFNQPVTEFHDTSLRMQGISYTFSINF